MVPYTLDTNDMKFVSTSGFPSGDDFFTYLRDAFDVLYAEGVAGAPKMLSIGLHCRLVGRPARIAALERFLDHVQSHDGVWIARRVDIARHWVETVPAGSLTTVLLAFRDARIGDGDGVDGRVRCGRGRVGNAAGVGSRRSRRQGDRPRSRPRRRRRRPADPPGARPAAAAPRTARPTGTATDAGFPEHTFTWDVALLVQDMLTQRGATTSMSRADDTGPAPCVDQRAAAANAAHPDAIVSIHGDGGPASGHGFHVNYSAPPLQPTHSAARRSHWRTPCATLWCRRD